MSEELLIGVAEILVMGLVAQWLAWRFKLPSILLLLFFGFLLGPVTHLLDPDHLFGNLLFPVVSLSVAVVLFEGGLSLSFSELGEQKRTVQALVSVGILITWGLGATAAYYLTSLGLDLALLLGALLVVSGPTVIIPLLRFVRPTGRIGSIIKWEGIINDPIGAVLAVLVFGALISSGPQHATAVVSSGIFYTIVIGGGLGVVGALLLIIPFRRYWIPDFLQNPIVLMMVILTFTVSNLLQQDAGLLTVTVMGMILANQKDLILKHIIEFKENLRVLLIAALFIILAARLNVESFTHLGWGSIAFVAVLILVVRPAAVFLSTIGSGLRWQEKAFLSWMAPRGIVAASVSAVFALELAEAGYANAEAIVPLTFLVIIGTVTVYGLTAAPVGRWLKVAHPDPQGLLLVGAHRWARNLAKILQAAGFQVLLVDSNHDNVSAAEMEGLQGYHGSILSEYVAEEIDMGGIGRLLALTSNDEVNSLAALHFIEEFGRSEVYQLALKRKLGDADENVAQPLRGRCLFHPTMSFNKLNDLFLTGARLEQVNLSQNFTFADFQERYGAQTTPLFAIDEATRVLTVMTSDNVNVPRAGQTLIVLVPPGAPTPLPGDKTAAAAPPAAVQPPTGNSKGSE